MTDKFADYATVEDFQPAAAPRNAEAGEMSAIDSSSMALEMPAGPRVLPDSAPAGNGQIRVQGKFFFAGNTKHFVKGVTYGPFGPGSHGAQFPEVETVAHDFALMRSAGANTVRVFTVPPVWLLDAAEQTGLKVLVGLPWSQHVAFLDSASIQAEIRAAIAGGVRACRRHAAVFAYLIGNEIPPDMIRWHGVEAVRRFLRELVGLVRQEHPGALVSYANFPSTEYLTVDFTDFLCFNIYLHEETASRRYIARLHNLSVDKPLVLTEFGIDAMRNGADEQARILEIAERFPFCRIISQPNKGLSVARNVGAEAASGEIVAYTDSDCVADPDWLTYLVAKMETSNLAACGGPNFPPPEDSLVPAAVAVSPGGPTHVLISDEIAEHIAGCNMAFRRDALLALGGFDPQYRAAGDDVDICWRFQDAGYTIGFSPAAIVWHFRRNTVRAYLGQQKGYGKAEALVYAKHPFRFNLFGQAKWLGRIYGDLSAALLLSRKPVIYSGVFGRGLFQTMYEPPSSLTALLPLTFEWSLAALLLAPAGVIVGGWFWLLTVPLLATWAMCVNGALKAPIDPRFSGTKARALVALLIYLGPLLRGWERLKWRVKTMQAEDHVGLPAVEQRARINWPARTFTLSYWNEFGGDKEALLAGLMDFLLPQKYFVVPDTGWSKWDLKISRGLWSRAFG